MKHHLSILSLALLCLISTGISAKIKLPALFSNHMVLQQQSDAAIWGKSDKNGTVRVTTSWNKKSYSTKPDEQGNWKLKVNTPKAGGPYSIHISDGESLTLENIMIGEVWICSGQSNMQMTMSGYQNQPVLGANEAIATSQNQSIRLFTVERNKSLERLDDVSGEWQECKPENVARFSAAAYFFGKMLNETLDVPVGLICSSWGGTRIEPWMSDKGINKFEWVSLPDRNSNEEFSQQTPTVLFNAMISPLVGLSFRGALWYQGESNRNQPEEYEKLMAGLVENWREEWGIGEFPFYYVQIAPYHYGTEGLNSARLREAQLQALKSIPNAGMVSLMDAGEEFCIHPANKEIAGKRLAYLALAKTYGINGIAYSGPVLMEMTVEGNVVKLTFDHAKNGLTTFGKALTHFVVAGKNKKFFPATASITRDGISLSSPLVEHPVAVRYAFDDFVVGELYNTEGLPASSFRTDDWEN